MSVLERLAHAWNAFTDNRREENVAAPASYGTSFGRRPDRYRGVVSSEKTIISSIYTRLSIDVASAVIRHIKQDENGRYLSTVNSGINECLTVEANIDQAATQFRQDVALSLFDKGVIAIVPVKTSTQPNEGGSFDVKTIRVGHIKDWYPHHVRVSVYNEDIGDRQDIVVPKRIVAIVENPLYAVMNEQNSILQRIIRKLQLLDAVDEAAGSGKLDIIVQLPYTIRSESKQQQAENRRELLEAQLKNSKYGIGYMDSTERITQLNRPAENNMLKQIEYLMGQLYGQLGLDESILKGTADEATMLNYNNRTIKPVLKAITEAMTRTFLTKTARTQGQKFEFLRDPFEFVPLKDLAEILDKFLRNEVITSNESRSVIGFRPADDPKADMLINSNMPQGEIEPAPESVTSETPGE